jgi:hypothetical protein
MRGRRAAHSQHPSTCDQASGALPTYSATGVSGLRRRRCSVPARLKRTTDFTAAPARAQRFLARRWPAAGPRPDTSPALSDDPCLPHRIRNHSHVSTQYSLVSCNDWGLLLGHALTRPLRSRRTRACRTGSETTVTYPDTIQLSILLCLQPYSGRHTSPAL